MAVQKPPVNENHNPSPSEEQALDVLKDGRDDDRPWGRVNPMYLREVAGMKKSTAEYALRQLHTAGWIKKPADGLYELVGDPRSED